LDFGVINRPSATLSRKIIPTAHIHAHVQHRISCCADEPRKLALEKQLLKILTGRPYKYKLRWLP
jgi:hypothetical protein